MISEITGIEFEYITSDDWAFLVQEFKNNRVDVIHSVSITSRLAPTTLYTKPYFRSATALYSNPNNILNTDMSTLHGKALAIPGGYEDVEVLEKHYPDIKVVKTKTLIEAAILLGNGKVDGMLGEAVVIDYVLSKNYIPNVQFTGIVNLLDSNYEDQNYRIGVSSSNQWLFDIINRAYLSIKDSQLTDIFGRWVRSANIEIASARQLKIEQSYLNKIGVIDVCMGTSSSPLQLLLWKLIARNLSVDYNIIINDDYLSEAHHYISETCDVWGPAGITTKRRKAMNFTTPLATQPTHERDNTTRFHSFEDAWLFQH